MGRLVCCCEAIAFGDPCDNCAGGDHEGCTNKIDIDTIKPPDVVRERGPDAPVRGAVIGPGIVAPRAGADPDGVWVAYYHDRSSFAVFATEIEQLRFALDHGMAVTKLPYGVDIGDHERNERMAKECPPPPPQPVAATQESPTVSDAKKDTTSTASDPNKSPSGSPTESESANKTSPTSPSTTAGRKKPATKAPAKKVPPKPTVDSAAKARIAKAVKR